MLASAFNEKGKNLTSNRNNTNKVTAKTRHIWLIGKTSLITDLAKILSADILEKCVTLHVCEIFIYILLSHTQQKQNQNSTDKQKQLPKVHKILENNDKQPQNKLYQKRMANSILKTKDVKSSRTIKVDTANNTVLHTELYSP